ncbi:Enamine deaminase RidA, house cleaning of reactive enamine intermediates, YjgF/YER057c/UK114 family [Salinihabitans flavidus]|uniref:Enamine deaminase RidA, house cleaning of reactive enamine intermediates, YjgF/YER057c/UK114 family n=1 Tax=Salinihabitans flavidus TaxID=569882 RepID=A0A1H8REN2_9RHOB|nr:RidA family protein [Salinihabitans flavidus]SEO64493.1 Enamine deaminase RidA, house cleaning of reactive enamine intermediates, YjgF/YER057c/UK114 family [Salinihabitans flavidus]
MTPLTPAGLAPPFAAYSHGIAVPASRLLVTSGQLGLAPDGIVPEDAQGQAEICLSNIDLILAEDGMTRANILRLNAYVTDRAHMAGYMAARDAYLGGLAALPASTLLIVSGFTRPEFLVEIEAIAAT